MSREPTGFHPGILSEWRDTDMSLKTIYEWCVSSYHKAGWKFLSYLKLVFSLYEKLFGQFYGKG